MTRVAITSSICKNKVRLDSLGFYLVTSALNVGVFIPMLKIWMCYLFFMLKTWIFFINGLSVRTSSRSGSLTSNRNWEFYQTPLSYTKFHQIFSIVLHFSIFMKVPCSKYSFKRWFLDIGSVLQPVLFSVCLWYMAQYSMRHSGEGRGCLEIREAAKACCTFRCFFGPFCSVLMPSFLVCVSHLMASASFVFSVLEVEETHQYLCFKYILKENWHISLLIYSGKIA